MDTIQDNTISGTLVVLPEIWSPQLKNAREIYVYLPPSYEGSDRRYPVIYMHDAQNLFDQGTSFSGEWEVDETLEGLAQQGVEAIVVGIPNMGAERISESCPFPCDEDHSGERYLTWIVETLKPLVDDVFRTLPEPEFTGMVGSSMGGLITLYAAFHYPEVFGFTGVLSPAFWFAERAIFPYVAQRPHLPGRKIYLDMGTDEGEEELDDARQMRDLLFQKGFQSGQDVLYVEDEGADHTEAEWAFRLQIALRFLLPRKAIAVQAELAQAA